MVRAPRLACAQGVATVALEPTAEGNSPLSKDWHPGDWAGMSLGITLATDHALGAGAASLIPEIRLHNVGPDVHRCILFAGVDGHILRPRRIRPASSACATRAVIRWVRPELVERCL